MKILHIIPNLRKGGAERIALDMSVELQNQGHEVQIIALHPSNSYIFLTETLHYKIVSTQLSLSLIRKNQVDVIELQAVIDDFQPAIIHSHLFESEINLAFCKIPKECKRIIHFHDNMKQMRSLSLKTFLSKELLANYYERSLVLKNLKQDSVVIGVSKDTNTYIRKNLPKKIYSHLLHNAINTKRFTSIINEQESNTLAMIGSLTPNKGQKLAIETIYELKQRKQEVKLRFVGDGKLKNELIELTKQLALEDSIEFLGLVDFPEEILSKSSIYIHTSHSESFGLVMIEAMACGLPVVCTDGIGNRDLIREGENGFMIWERDPKLLADKIQFLLENENERKRMGENARLFAQDFGMEKYVEKLIAIYKS